ncbi:hypothetical protein HAX54_009141, partial [Datura stramonium]|nr:hypothetical protein [Datura stramonium]
LHWSSGSADEERQDYLPGDANGLVVCPPMTIEENHGSKVAGGCWPKSWATRSVCDARGWSKLMESGGGSPRREDNGGGLRWWSAEVYGREEKNKEKGGKMRVCSV